jgi:molybdate transport system substrate-binding protein
MTAPAPAALQGISSMATRALLAALGALFEQQTGQRIAIESVGGVDAAKRVQAGEVFDVVILGSDAIDKLIASGHLMAGSRVDLVTSPISIAINSGAPRAHISSASSLKDSLISAQSISYSTGPSGVYLAQLFEKMGIAEALKAKTIVPPPGVPVGSLVAKGEVEIGFQQRSELINLPGIDIVGNLPDEVAFITTFSAAIPVNSPSGRHTAVAQFLRFANSPQATPLKQAQGMNPI